MNILIVTEYYPESLKSPMKGGVESRSFYISQELSKKHNVTILCSYQKGQTKENNVGRVKVIRAGKNHPYTAKGSIFSRLGFAISACRIGKKLGRQDIVEGYNFISYIPAHIIGKKHNAKKIATYHEVWIGEWIKNKGIITGIFGEVWERIAVNLKWDKIISVSNFTAKKLKKYIPPEKINVIYNGIELKKYRNLKVSKFKEPTICCVARLTPQKRVDDLINALPLIKKEIPNIKCKIIGTGDELQKLKALAIKNSVGKDIEFLGFVESHMDVIKTIKKSHLFVLPSVLEGFGMVAIESMACGVPYVVTDIAPLRESTGNGLGGYLFSPKNIDELAAKSAEILKNKNIRDKKIKEMKKHVEQFDWKKIVKDVESVYNN